MSKLLLRLKKAELALTLVFTLTLAACATMMDSREQTKSSSFCLIVKPISWSKHDTDETLVQVKRLNAQWKALCSPASIPAKAPG